MLSINAGSLTNVTPEEYCHKLKKWKDAGEFFPLLQRVALLKPEEQTAASLPAAPVDVETLDVAKVDQVVVAALKATQRALQPLFFHGACFRVWSVATKNNIELWGIENTPNGEAIECAEDFLIEHARHVAAGESDMADDLYNCARWGSGIDFLVMPTLAYLLKALCGWEASVVETETFRRPILRQRAPSGKMVDYMMSRQSRMNWLKLGLIPGYYDPIKGRRLELNEQKAMLMPVDARSLLFMQYLSTHQDPNHRLLFETCFAIAAEDVQTAIFSLLPVPTSAAELVEVKHN